MTLVAVLYSALAFWLALYGANALVFTALFLRHRSRAAAPPPVAEANLPSVTVQLPIFNEKYVATRLLDAVCALDYPRDRLQIQVLDDSSDQTVGMVARRVQRWQRRGLRIEQVLRPTREGYKAGALQYGLERATGEFVAIFDADFVPGRDWLRRTVAHVCAPNSEQVGLVQTRWSHLNGDFSPLTEAQGLSLDGHFGVEQVARSRGGLLFNFNGTAGLWRRSCIEAAGGWSSATLCEDLDLSYRAQLAGWRLVFDPTIEAPAEIPAQMASYKRQQFRWAKGSMQVARRLLGRVLRSPLSPWQKLQGFLHLTGYAAHPLMVGALLLTLPLMVWGWPEGMKGSWDLFGTFSLTVWASAPLLYAVAQRSLHGAAWHERYRWMPMLVLLGSGLALSNTRAVLEGLFGAPGGEFRRTPKFRLEGRSGSWQGSEYALAVDWTTVGELALALYALLACAIAAWRGQWLTVPFLMVYVLSFGWVGALSLWQARESLRPARRPRKTAVGGRW